MEEMPCTSCRMQPVLMVQWLSIQPATWSSPLGMEKATLVHTARLIPAYYTFWKPHLPFMCDFTLMRGDVVHLSHLIIQIREQLPSETLRERSHRSKPASGCWERPLGRLFTISRILNSKEVNSTAGPQWSAQYYFTTSWEPTAQDPHGATSEIPSPLIPNIWEQMLVTKVSRGSYKEFVFPVLLTVVPKIGGHSSWHLLCSTSVKYAVKMATVRLPECSPEPENEGHAPGITSEDQNVEVPIFWYAWLWVSSHFKLCQERHTLERGSSTDLQHRLLKEDQMHFAILKGQSKYFRDPLPKLLEQLSVRHIEERAVCTWHSLSQKASAENGKEPFRTRTGVS